MSRETGTYDIHEELEIQKENEAARDTEYKAFNIKQMFSSIYVGPLGTVKEQKLASFKYEVENDITTNGKPAQEFYKDEFAMCMKCKEWTEIAEPCCGSEYVHTN